jgi:hypothetical protein
VDREEIRKFLSTFEFKSKTKGWIVEQVLACADIGLLRQQQPTFPKNSMITITPAPTI